MVGIVGMSVVGTVVATVVGAVGSGPVVSGGALGLPGAHEGSTKSKPFGDDPPALLTALTVALATTPDITAAGDDVGHALRNAAAAPAACGEAIDVPDKVLVDWDPPIHALRIDEPGAKRSRQEPTFEYGAR